MKALLVYANNLVRSIDFPDNFTLQWAEEIIGDCDCIEIVRPMHLPRKYVLLIDEEGKLKPHTPNPICSILYGYKRHGDYIAGKAIIVKEDIINGEPDLTGLDDEDIKEIHKAIAKAVNKE